MLRFSKEKAEASKTYLESTDKGLQDLAVGEDTPLLLGSAHQAPYRLHSTTSGDIVICIQDAQGRHSQGVVKWVNTPRESLGGLKRLPFNGYLEKIITQYGAYPLKVVIRLIKNFIYHKEKGVAHTVKSALHLPLVLGATVLGALLPTHLLPDLGSNLKDSILSMVPFISDKVAFGLGVFTSTLVCASWGAKLSDKILSFSFEHILDTPDTVLYFTQKEMKACLTKEDLEKDDDILEKLDYAVEFLQGEYAKNEKKFQDFEESGDGIKIKRAAEKLRKGDFKSLLKFATIIRDKEMVALSFENRNQAKGKDASREAEMFIAQKVIEDFSYKQNL